MTIEKCPFCDKAVAEISNCSYLYPVRLKGLLYAFLAALTGKCCENCKHSRWRHGGRVLVCKNTPPGEVWYVAPSSYRCRSWEKIECLYCGRPIRKGEMLCPKCKILRK
jgi:hypothetical protein